MVSAKLNNSPYHRRRDHRRSQIRFIWKLESVIKVLLEVVVTLVTFPLRLGTLLVGLLITLVPMIPELLALGLEMGAMDVLKLYGL
ncbi:hypothetical protein WG66_002298 [Moniliophthora roreri]|nr:hypothetical protein WG66_002298 [Moniliophthora roreri]